MATGSHPYPHNNPIELYQYIMSSPPPSLSGVSQLSPEIADFVGKWYFIFVFV